MIALDGLALSSRGTTLGPLTLQLDGGVTGVVGPSGAGKTLLLLTLAGLLPRVVVAGSARVDGPIAMVFSNDALDDGRSALGNVVDVARAARSARARSVIPRTNDAVGDDDDDNAGDDGTADADAARLLSALGLDADVQQRAPRFLSGGQRKRVGIARALVIRPRALLLDDATAGLDPLTAAEVVDLIIAQVAQLPGACALFATQDVDTVLPRLRRTLWLRPAPAHAGGAPRVFDGGVVDVADLPSPFAPRAYVPFLAPRAVAIPAGARR